MVPLIQSEQEGLGLGEEPDLTTLEGFHWEGISVSSPGSIRKRSLSESSVAIEKTAASYSFFSNHGPSKDSEQRQISSGPVTEGTTSEFQMQPDVKQEASSLPSSPFRTDSIAHGRRLSLQMSPDVTSLATISTKEIQSGPEFRAQLLESQDMLESPGERYCLTSTLAISSTVDAATDSSYTSGNEQNDSQGIGKKRRATGVSCLTIFRHCRLDPAVHWHLLFTDMDQPHLPLPLAVLFNPKEIYSQHCGVWGL